MEDADVRAEWFADVEVAGLTAGTSTPDDVIDRVEARIRACANDTTAEAVSMQRLVGVAEGSR